MKPMILGVALFFGIISAMAWGMYHEFHAMDAVDSEAAIQRAERAEMHTVTPRAWRECREVCGDSAALLPAGDGSLWVVCSCLPRGAVVGAAK